MRKQLLIAAVAAAFGVAAQSAMASPVSAVGDLNTYLSTGGNPDTSSPSTGNFFRGYELAGLEYATSLGYSSGTAISSLQTAITGDPYNTTGPFAGTYLGQEALGLARSGDPGGSVANFYNVVEFSAPGNGTNDVAGYVANDIVSSTTTPTANDIVSLSNHVLAANLVATPSIASQYTSQLDSIIQNYLLAGNASNLTTDASSANVQAGNFDQTAAIASALYALEKGGSGDSAEETALHTALLASVNGTVGSGTETLEISAGNTDFGYSIDQALGVLALQAFGDPTDTALITDLQNQLAGASSTSGIGYNPFNNADSGFNGVSPYYAGIVIQALPEPATLSLLGLAGLGLMARRRRSA